MQFYEFGAIIDPVILLFPGTCCHWKANFGAVIPLLKRDFRVVCVSYDGFDETEETVFPDMLTETEKIETYIQTNCGGHICAAWGEPPHGLVCGEALYPQGLFHAAL